jgi:hypothetical protein
LACLQPRAGNLSVVQGSYLIYGLIDPRDGQLRYVGKTARGLARPYEHGRVSILRKDGTYKGNWIRQLHAEGLTYEVEVLEEHESPETLVDAEQFYIAYFRGLGCRLTNLTDGGEGVRGHRHSSATRARLSDLAKMQFSNPEARQRASEVARVQWTTEARQRQSELKRRHFTKPEAHKRASDAARTWQTEEVRIQRSRARGGRPFRDQNGVVYQTQSDAARRLGISQGNISSVLLGVRTHANGYRFDFVEV